MLHYTATNEGTEPLVLLHGFLENENIWSLLEPHLDKRFKLIKIDLPGHGKSEAMFEVNTMEAMAEAVLEVISSLNLPNYHLLGHSMGGYVSLALAEKDPSRLKSLTLFFSTYFEDSEEKRDVRRRSLRVIEENFPTYAKAGIPPLFNPIELENLKDELNLAKKVALETSLEGTLASVKGMMERKNRKEIVEEYKGKILFISGKHDQAVSSKELLEDLSEKQNIKSYLLDCGHNGHLELPEICGSILNHELI